MSERVYHIVYQRVSAPVPRSRGGLWRYERTGRRARPNPSRGGGAWRQQPSESPDRV